MQRDAVLPCFIVEVGSKEIDYLVFKGSYEFHHSGDWLVDADEANMWFDGSIWQDGVPNQMWVTHQPVAITEAEYSELKDMCAKSIKTLSVFNATCEALSKKYGRGVARADEFPSSEGCFVYSRRTIFPYLVGWGLFRGRIAVADANGMRWNAEAEEFAVPVHPEGEGDVFKFLQMPTKVPDAIWENIYKEAKKLVVDRAGFMDKCRKLIESKKSRF